MAALIVANSSQEVLRINEVAEAVWRFVQPASFHVKLFTYQISDQVCEN